MVFLLEFLLIVPNIECHQKSSVRVRNNSVAKESLPLPELVLGSRTAALYDKNSRISELATS